MTGGTTISLAYGLDIQNADDPFVELATRAIASVAQAGAPGAFFVDFIPWLKYIPEWIPGAGFKKTAKDWRKLQEDVREVPYAEAAKKAVCIVMSTRLLCTNPMMFSVANSRGRATSNHASSLNAWRISTINMTSNIKLMLLRILQALCSQVRLVFPFMNNDFYSRFSNV